VAEAGGQVVTINSCCSALRVSESASHGNMTQLRRAVLATPLLFAVSFLPAGAQDQRNNRNNNFNQGLRQGARGGSYSSRRDDRRYNNGGYHNGGYHNDRYQNDQGGIGPGKGALIGGAGGAVLGAVFGGGLKGTLIGGAAGAGIGAAVGGVAQSNRRDQYGRPY